MRVLKNEYARRKLLLLVRGSCDKEPCKIADLLQREKGRSIRCVHDPAPRLCATSYAVQDTGNGQRQVHAGQVAAQPLQFSWRVEYGMALASGTDLAYLAR